jgi:hypothetical protein
VIPFFRFWQNIEIFFRKDRGEFLQILQDWRFCFRVGLESFSQMLRDGGGCSNVCGLKSFDVQPIITCDNTIITAQLCRLKNLGTQPIFMRQ